MSSDQSGNDGASDSRSRVLDAAWSLVGERELRDVTLSEVAKRAGVSRQAIYLFFGNRSGLLTAMIRRRDRSSGINRRFVAALRMEPAAQALEAAIATWFAYLPDIQPAARALSAASAADPEAAAAWGDRMQAMRGLYLAIAGRLAAEDALAPGWTVDKAADFILAATDYAVWHRLVVECGWSPAEAAVHVARAVKAAMTA